MDSNIIVFNSLMEESKNWAKDVGMKESDICDAINSVRKEKRQKNNTDVWKESIIQND